MNNMSRPIVERPIRSIGRFFARLPENEQKIAIRLAKQADRTPKHKLESEYYRLERLANG